MADFVGALDQGTTSTRFFVFDHEGRERGRHQLEHTQLLPRPGWVEHDPVEIWERARSVIEVGLARAGVAAGDLAAIGIANQRETTVVWDRRTGRPLHNALVWQDTRTAGLIAALERSGGGELVRERTGLVPATYFAGGKLAWLLEHVAGLRAAAEAGDALFGTVDSWLTWHLTGGQHTTDVTNASRTMLMDLESLSWDERLLELFHVPRAMLPEIRPSSGPDAARTMTGGPLGGEVLLSASLGDQQAAMVGQVCFSRGDAKNTYGTGNFLLVNTGTSPVRSSHGLLTTVLYQRAGEPAHYALEGSVAVTGSAVQWLRDQLGIIRSATEIEALAGQVPDSEGLYFVPAFSGLFAPYWRSDARGAIVGMSRFHTAAHLARATLEAICYQSRDVLEAMVADAGQRPSELKVDGGVSANALCMQLQADVLGLPVLRPAFAETTALGAAYAAGLAVGFWRDPEELRRHWHEDGRWLPSWDGGKRAGKYAEWKKAVERTFDWASAEEQA